MIVGENGKCKLERKNMGKERKGCNVLYSVLFLLPFLSVFVCTR